MAKKILFLEDLYNFYSNNYKKSVHFSSSKTGVPIVVQALGKINFESADDSKEGLTPVVLQACHTDENLNGSSIKYEVMETALPSFKNRPILGYIHYVNDQPEFYKHNMHEDENGEIVYDERPIGIIPESCDAKLVYDEDKDRTYVEVNGYLFDEYSKASEIIKREGECFCSVELCIRELSYDAKEKHLDIESFFFQGVTILGKTPNGENVMPGMDGANIKLKDFSLNNSMFADFTDFEIKMNEIQERLNKLESACSNIQFSKEGGNLEKMKFQELLEKYNKTAEDIDFEYENMSDEELEAKFAELFADDDTDGTDENTDDATTDSDPELTQDETDNAGDGQDDEDDSDDEPESEDDGSDDDDAAYLDSKKKFNIIVKHGEKEFSLSLQEKIWALCDLVNAVYADADNTWYGVQVYDDYVIMEDWCTGKYFKQNYSENDGVFTLTGDRVAVYAEFVTEDELKSLNDMRANYEALVQFKAEHEKQNFEVKKATTVKPFANFNRTNGEGRYGNLFVK
jgi:hypothetical protein